MGHRGGVGLLLGLLLSGCSLLTGFGGYSFEAPIPVNDDAAPSADAGTVPVPPPMRVPLPIPPPPPEPYVIVAQQQMPGAVRVALLRDDAGTTDASTGDAAGDDAAEADTDAGVDAAAVDATEPPDAEPPPVDAWAAAADAWAPSCDGLVRPSSVRVTNGPIIPPAPTDWQPCDPSFGPESQAEGTSWTMTARADAFPGAGDPWTFNASTCDFGIWRPPPSGGTERSETRGSGSFFTPTMATGEVTFSYSGHAGPLLPSGVCVTHRYATFEAVP